VQRHHVVHVPATATPATAGRRGVTWPEFQQLHKGKAVTPAQWQEHNAIIAKGGTPPPVPAPGLTQEEKLAIAKKVSLSEPSKDKELELAQKIVLTSSEDQEVTKAKKVQLTEPSGEKELAVAKKITLASSEDQAVLKARKVSLSQPSDEGAERDLKRARKVTLAVTHDDAPVDVVDTGGADNADDAEEAEEAADAAEEV